MPREPADTADKRITNNTVTLRRSATITAGVTYYNVTDCLSYWTSKAQPLPAEHPPRAQPERRELGPLIAGDWASWRAIGFDTTGDIIVP
jgi:hypothetical protein